MRAGGGALYLRFVLLKRACLRVSPHTCWADGRDVTPSHQGNTTVAYQILLPFHFPLPSLHLSLPRSQN